MLFFFHCFKNLSVLHVIQSLSSDQNVPLSFHRFEISLVSTSSSHDTIIKMFHSLFIVLKISLLSMSSSHETTIRMFYCLFTVLKISLFSMSSSHETVIRMFHCLFTVLKISLLYMSSSHDPWAECSIVFSLVLKSQFSPVSSYSVLPTVLHPFVPRSFMHGRNDLQLSFPHHLKKRITELHVTR